MHIEYALEYVLKYPGNQDFYISGYSENVVTFDLFGLSIPSPKSNQVVLSTSNPAQPDTFNLNFKH